MAMWTRTAQGPGNEVDKPECLILEVTLSQAELTRALDHDSLNVGGWECILLIVISSNTCQ